MSGAEFIALLGILANIEQMVEVSGKLVKRAVSFYNDSRELPKTLEELQTFLPGLAMAVRRRSDQSMLEKLSQGDRRVLALILQNLKDKVQELEMLLKDYLPAEDASSGRKLMKAIGSFGLEKKIDKITKSIFERYMPLLNFVTVENPTLPIELVGAAMESTYFDAGAKSNPHYLVKIQRDDDFVGREIVMDRLNALLSQIGKHNRVALVALGGIGKTRIALEYALKYKRSTDTSVFWVHASSPTRIAEAYDEIARIAKLQISDPKTTGQKSQERDRMRAVHDWLESEESGRWLLVIDNADDQDLIYGTSQLADYFPRSDMGSIILTTRDKTVGIKFTGSASKIIAIEALGVAASTALLQGKLGQDVADEESCRALVAELEGIPLALVQAAAYINEQSITIKEYLALYQSSENSRINLLSEDFEDVVRKAQDTKSPIATTWVISFEIIKSRNQLAASILSMMCFMDSQAIPISLLESGETLGELMKALGVLQAFSLITPRKIESDYNGITEKSFDLHRLVRLSMRNWLKLHGQVDLWTAATLKSLARKYPSLAYNAWEQQSRWAAYLPHAMALLASSQFLGASADNDVPNIFHSQEGSGKHTADGVMCGLCAATLMLEVSRSLEFLNERPQECSMWAQRAMVLKEYILGATDRETIEAMYQYAKALYREDKTEEAKAIGLRTVQLIATSHQPLNIQARSVMIQATLLTVTGLFKEAEPLYIQCIDMYKEFYGPEHHETLLSIEELAWNYEHQKKLKDSQKLLREVVETRKRLSGPEHPETLRITQNLGVLYDEDGQYDEAARLSSIVSDMRSRVLGPMHPQTLATMTDVAATYNNAGRFAESMSLALRVAEIEKKVLGPEHPNTLTTMSILAYSYEGLGRLDEAEKLRVEVFQARTRLLGEQNKFTINATIELAKLYEKQKKYSTAEPLRLQIFRSQILTRGIMNEKTIDAIQRLFNNYVWQNRYLEVTRVGIDLITIQKASQEQIQPDAIFNMAEVAVAWVLLGELAEAEKLLVSAMKHAANVLKPNDATMIHCKRTLADVLVQKLGSYNEAEISYREMILVLEKDPKPNKFLILSVKSFFAGLLVGASRIVEAENMFISTEELWLSLPESERAEHWNPASIRVAVDYVRGRYRKAESGRLDLLKEECKTWAQEDEIGVQHTILLMIMSGLGQLYSRLRIHAKSDQILGLVRRAYHKLRGPSNSRTLGAILWECWNLSHMENDDTTLNRCIRAKEILTAMYPPIQEDVLFAHLILSRLYFHNTQYMEAEKFALYVSSKEESRLGPKSMLAIRAKEALGAAYSAQNKLVESKAVLLDALDTSEELLGPQNYLSLSIRSELAKTYEKEGRDGAAAAMRKEVKDDTEKLDWGLSEEQRKKDGVLLENVIRWLEREVSDII